MPLTVAASAVAPAASIVGHRAERLQPAGRGGPGSLPAKIGILHPRGCQGRGREHARAGPLACAANPRACLVQPRAAPGAPAHAHCQRLGGTRQRPPAPCAGTALYPLLQPVLARRECATGPGCPGTIGDTAGRAGPARADRAGACALLPASAARPGTCRHARAGAAGRPAWQPRLARRGPAGCWGASRCA